MMCSAKRRLLPPDTLSRGRVSICGCVCHSNIDIVLALAHFLCTVMYVDRVSYVCVCMGAKAAEYMHIPVLGGAHARGVELGSAQSDVDLLSLLCVCVLKYLFTKDFRG
jgi:hypothetical protein